MGPLLLAGCSLNRETAGLATTSMAASAPSGDVCGSAVAKSGSPADTVDRASGSAIQREAAAPERGLAGQLACPTRPQGPVLETGALPAQPALVSVPIGGAAPPSMSNTEELFIDFEPAMVTLSEKEQNAIREAAAVRLAGGDKVARICAARGGSGNWFDQAVVAQKRARVVNELLPPRMVASLEFDPALPEDTVRIEFVKRSQNGG